MDDFKAKGIYFAFSAWFIVPLFLHNSTRKFMVIHFSQFFFKPSMFADIFYRSGMVTILIRLQIKLEKAYGLNNLTPGFGD